MAADPTPAAPPSLLYAIKALCDERIAVEMVATCGVGAECFGCSRDIPRVVDLCRAVVLAAEPPAAPKEPVTAEALRKAAAVFEGTSALWCESAAIACRAYAESETDAGLVPYGTPLSRALIAAADALTARGGPQE